MTATTTRSAGRTELKGGLVALSLAAIVGGWAALTSGQTPRTDAQAAPPPAADPPARPQASVLDLPPIPTVVPLSALLNALPAGQLPPIPLVADAPVLSALASGAPSTVAAPAPSFTAPSAPPAVVVAPAQPVAAPVASSFAAPIAPLVVASQPPVYAQQRSTPSYPMRIRTRSSR